MTSLYFSININAQNTRKCNPSDIRETVFIKGPFMNAVTHLGGGQKLTKVDLGEGGSGKL